MLKSIRAVADGEVLFGPSIADKLLNFFHNNPSQPKSKTSKSPFPELTDREREILTRIARQLPDKVPQFYTRNNFA